MQSLEEVLHILISAALYIDLGFECALLLSSLEFNFICSLISSWLFPLLILLELASDTLAPLTRLRWKNDLWLERTLSLFFPLELTLSLP
jgi:hypothetical protein